MLTRLMTAPLQIMTASDTFFPYLYNSSQKSAHKKLNISSFLRIVSSQLLI